MLGRQSVIMRPTFSTADSIRRFIVRHLPATSARSTTRFSIQFTSNLSATNKLPNSSWISRAIRRRSSSLAELAYADNSRICAKAPDNSAVRSMTRNSSSRLVRCSWRSAWRRSEISLNSTTAPQIFPSSTIWCDEYSTAKDEPSAFPMTRFYIFSGVIPTWVWPLIVR